MAGLNLEKLRFLVVDDRQPMRHLMRILLGTLGAKQIVEARDGNAAFQEVKEGNIDIVIVDWEMENGNGIDFIRMTRTAKDSPNPFLPIIMMTGYTELKRIVEARDAGVTEFLAKPITARSLAKRLVAIIESPRPFVRTKTYFGPDRRRKNEPFSGPERRGSGAPTSAGARTGGAANEQSAPTKVVART